MRVGATLTCYNGNKKGATVMKGLFAVLCVLFAWMAYGPGLQNGWVWFAFLTGGFFSGLAGYIGMRTATYASARTANAARRSLNAGLRVAFRSGAVCSRTKCSHALVAEETYETSSRAVIGRA